MTGEYRILLRNIGPTALTEIKSNSRVAWRIEVIREAQSEPLSGISSISLAFFNSNSETQQYLTFYRRDTTGSILTPEDENFYLSYDFCSIKVTPIGLLDKDQIYLFYNPPLT